METNNKQPLRILVLDGGGSKGVYTLGILKELELKLGQPLNTYFQLIYGTSTGSIIGSLIALGKTIPEIEDLYFDLIPKIMSGKSRRQRSEILRLEAEKIFGEKKFDEFKTDIGIVALNFDTQKPLIFKSNIKQAHGMQHSFEPGFGKTIAEAVRCSSAAYPVFNMVETELNNINSRTKVCVLDGGFIANDPTLFALIDAVKAFKVNIEEIRLLSLGVGSYIEKPVSNFYKVMRQFRLVKFTERVISSNTNTSVTIAKLLFPELRIVRISDTFSEPEYGTNMIEKDMDKLEKLNSLGRRSFASKEKEIEDLFK